MKCRDPKTGEVFEDIDTAIWNKCRRRDPCDTNCPLFKLRKHIACRDYVISHPADAARLMGLEVVEDKMKVNVDKPEKIRTNFAKIIVSGKREKPYYEIMYFHPEKNELCIGYSSYNLEYVFRWLQDIFEVVEEKEEPMEKKDKPRICQVLGVEVGEKFTYPGMIGEFWVTENGHLRSVVDDDDNKLMTCVPTLINHPDRIIRQPRFKEEEVEDAKNIMRFFQTAYSIERYKDSTLGVRSREQFLTNITNSLFPSLRPGQAVKLEDIVGDGL